MELKHGTFCTFNSNFIILLIVPYGIETLFIDIDIRQSDILLIVPYGIETMVAMVGDEVKELLIVPYGIETPDDAPQSYLHAVF